MPASSARVAQETVRLGDLEVRQAENRVIASQLRQERAQIEQDHFNDLLEAGLSDQEMEAMALLRESASLQQTAAGLGMAAAIAWGVQAAAYGTASGVAAYYQKYDTAAQLAAQAASATTQAFQAGSGVAAMEAGIRSTRSQLAAMQASLARMRQDWELRQLLSTQDIRIAAQETRVEEDGVRVLEQQREISALQADQAEQLVDFLHTKFTSVQLYDWMSGVLEDAYSSVLQNATATARLAAGQLMFERQEGAPPPIADDYWVAPTEDGFADEGAEAPDRHGLTGATRLLRDIVELDQYAFDTNQRKLQLTKTFSLAQLAPLELERLRSTGVAHRRHHSGPLRSGLPW